jgi:hypothetical protein
MITTRAARKKAVAVLRRALLGMHTGKTQVTFGVKTRIAPPHPSMSAAQRRTNATPIHALMNIFIYLMRRTGIAKDFCVTILTVTRAALTGLGATSTPVTMVTY